MTVFDREEVAKGMDRLGTHPDAKFLRQHLMTILCETMSPGLADGAVRHFEGRRTLASELIAALGLARGAEGGGADDGSGYVRTGSAASRAAQPVIARRVAERKPDADNAGT